MSKKKKAIHPDDYYNNGAFELARFGKVVSMRNLMDEDMHKQYLEFQIQQYDKTLIEINNLVSTIKEKVLQCNPLRLMEFLSSMRTFLSINLFSEIDVSTQNGSSLNIIEYIQSILVSSECHNDSEEDQSILYHEIMALTEQLYEKVKIFITIWGIKQQLENTDKDDISLEYAVESQLLFWVQGDRYQVFQVPFLEEMIVPYDSYLQEIYHISAVDVINGLKRLEVALSLGRLNAIDELRKLMDEFGNCDSQSEKNTFIVENSTRNYDVMNRMFGSGVNDIESITHWSRDFISEFGYAVGENTELFDHDQFSGWPIWNLPVHRKPFIKIQDKYYCFDYYLLFDNFYRALQRAIRSKGYPYADGWGKIQQETSEKFVESLFKKLLPGCKSYRGNYYQRDNENDILVVYKDVLFIIEVKAGAFTYTPAMTDLEAHKKSFEALVNKAGKQCERTEKYIQGTSPAIFYDHDKNIKFTVNKEDYTQIYSFCVTVDDFNSFAARAEKVAFVKVKTGTIALSVNDLWVYTEYFDTPIEFIHFLKHRRIASVTEEISLNDELDHLGLYIEKNVYSIHAKKMGMDNHKIHYTGYRDELDKYFASLYDSRLTFEKPVQSMSELFRNIIEWGCQQSTSGITQFTNTLLDFSDEGRDNFCTSVSMLLDRTQELKRQISGCSVQDCCYCIFPNMPGIIQCSDTYKEDYAKGLMVYHHAPNCYLICMEFDSNRKFVGLQYKYFELDEITGDEQKRLYSIGEKGVQGRAKTFLNRTKQKKIYPNDKCPCGSGKKYKKCCGK